MPRSSDSGQTEPLPALAAVMVVCLALGLYAGVLDDLPVESEDSGSVADPAIERIEHSLSRGGVVRPSRLSDPPAGPDGYRTNVTLTTARRVWHAGPTPPASVGENASRRVSVRLGPGRVSPGTLRVVVWP